MLPELARVLNYLEPKQGIPQKEIKDDQGKAPLYNHLGRPSTSSTTAPNLMKPYPKARPSKPFRVLGVLIRGSLAGKAADPGPEMEVTKRFRVGKKGTVPSTNMAIVGGRLVSSSGDPCLVLC